MFQGYSFDVRIAKDRIAIAQEALDAATQYAHAVSIGSLSILRRFLEASIQKTAHPQYYIERFTEMLNKKGKEIYWKRVRSHINLAIGYQYMEIPQCETDRPLIAKILCGFTRKRELLVPVWSDDAKLWIPGGAK